MSFCVLCVDVCRCVVCQSPCKYLCVNAHIAVCVLKCVSPVWDLTEFIRMGKVCVIKSVGVVLGRLLVWVFVWWGMCRCVYVCIRVNVF